MAQKKKKKLNVKKLIVLLLIFYLLIAGIIRILKEPIRNIIILNNTYVSDLEIIEAGKIKNYPSYFWLSSNKLKKNIKKIPLINDVKIKKNLKFQLIIEVSELKIICLDQNNKLLLENGSVIDNNMIYYGIPSLINYTPNNILNDFLKEMGELDYGTISGISEIAYSPSLDSNGNIVDDTRFLLKMNDDNQVYINIAKIKNLKYYQKIYASLGDKKGILHLDSGEYMEVK